MSSIFTWSPSIFSSEIKRPLGKSSIMMTLENARTQKFYG